MRKLILVRHGQSIWNLENRFTGWIDVGLSDRGVLEAKNASSILKNNGFSFDIAYTSVLKRAKDTLSIILDGMGLDIPIKSSWKLNERHYGALQGLNKDEVRVKVGDEQVLLWRRSFSLRPPLLDINDERNPRKDLKYKEISDEDIPLGESLEDTLIRVVDYWNAEIEPVVREGKRVIIVAHGNSIRALMKHLDNLSDEEVVKLEIETGRPICYIFDDDMKPVEHYYLEK